jgi:hypothetical protein
MFKKYQHIEKLGSDEVDSIEAGLCYVFYKIDGTNASIWKDENGLHFGSRTRELTLDNDNAGFMNAMIKDDRIIKYFEKHPNHRLYGEWLVPHALKTYRDDAWRKFYVFDVLVDIDDENEEYIAYENYKVMLDEFNLDYIPPICIVKNGTMEIFLKCLEKTGDFLIKDGMGNGEGIVIKNYDYTNKYGRKTWAKLIGNDFKEKHHKSWAPNIISNGNCVEEEIVNEYVSNTLIEKEYSKIAIDGWNSKKIPQLLSTIYHCLITEEMWSIIKKFNNPKIDFKILQNFTIRKIKESKKELF